MNFFRRSLTTVSLFLVAFLWGCASFNPPPIEDNRTSRKQVETSEQRNVSSRENSDQLDDLREREHVEMNQKKESTLITVSSKILFDIRSAEIKRSAWPTLDEVAKFIKDHPDHWVLVGGHTDSLPTRTQKYPSNWELSASRAVNVVKYLSQLDELDPSRLVAAGFGEHHPIASNKTEEGRKLNRRVEIYLIEGGFPGKDFGGYSSDNG